MEAARVGAQRGHEVILLEKEAELGGQVRIAQRAPGREEFGEVSRYLKKELERLKVDARLGVDATADTVLALGADIVVIATGATPRVPDVPGIQGGNVIQAWELLLGRNPGVGKRFVVVDGDKENQVAIGAAECLADQGKAVEIVTPLTHVGKDLDVLNLVPVYQRLWDKGVVMTPHMALKAVDGSCLILRNVYTEEEASREGIDGVVLAVGRKAEEGIYRSLKGRVKGIYRIGDCLAPRSVLSAISEGARVGRIL
jgi:NADPH-dependent 2,4-dienoyl-CoA reductase/sulfur reductase-like enzyme